MSDISHSPSRDAEAKMHDQEEDSPERNGSKYGPIGDPFGDETNAEVKYRTLTWWQCSLLMIAETISLGILSLPSVMATVGLVPGIVMLVVLGIIASYTGFVFGQFKQAFPHVANMADAGEVLMGAFGRELIGTAQVLVIVFGMGRYGLIMIFGVDYSPDLHSRQPSFDLYHCLECDHRTRHLHDCLGSRWTGGFLPSVVATDVEERFLHVNCLLYLNRWRGVHHCYHSRH